MTQTPQPTEDVLRDRLFDALRQNDARLCATIASQLQADSRLQAMEISQLGATPAFLAQVQNILNQINAARNARS